MMIEGLEPIIAFLAFNASISFGIQWDGFMCDIEIKVPAVFLNVFFYMFLLYVYLYLLCHLQCMFNVKEHEKRQD